LAALANPALDPEEEWQERKRSARRTGSFFMISDSTALFSGYQIPSSTALYP
jgi:hypothetical protein